MTPLPSPEIWHTGDFYLLCEWRRLTRIAEVGVDRAEFAATFLRRIVNCELYLGIDPYLPYSEMKWPRDSDLHVASIRFERHANVAKLVPTTSAEFLAGLATSSDRYSRPYDFVYIDANHERQAVLEDMELWWSHVSDRGILAGHDWSMSTGDHPGVKEAVMEFAEPRGLQVYYTTGDDPASWYIYKSGMPGPDWVRNPPLPAIFTSTHETADPGTA